MKRLLVTVMFFMLPFCLFAQFSIGIKSSVPFFNANRPFGDLGVENIDLSDMGFFPVINAGVFLHYSFNRSLALQAEIKYTIEGLFYQIKNIEISDLENVVFEYIEIPLLMQYRWGNKFNWFVQSGISLKYLTLTEYFNSRGQNVINEIDEQINNFVLKANIGSGFIYNFSQHFMVNGEMRWGYDITTIVNDIRFLKMDVSFGIAYKI
jgi:hypothetical protein